MKALSSILADLLSIHIQPFLIPPVQSNLTVSYLLPHTVSNPAFTSRALKPHEFKWTLGPKQPREGGQKSTTQSESTSEQDIVSSATPASRGKEICMQLNAIARLMNKKNSYW